MKRFIVIMVIFVISIPLIIFGVYGLNKNINNTISSNNPLTLSEDETEPRNPNPFEILMPMGVKGKISDIDLIGRKIKITDIKYLNNHLSGTRETSDYTVNYVEGTRFFKNLTTPARLDDLKAGEEIICDGEIIFEKKIVNAVVVYTGSFLDKDMQIPVGSLGNIEELNKANKSFILDLSKIYHGMGKYKVIISDATECYTRKDTNDVPDDIKITNGKIPDFVKNGTIVDLEVRIKQNDTNAYADRVCFFESSED